MYMCVREIKTPALNDEEYNYIYIYIYIHVLNV